MRFIEMCAHMYVVSVRLDSFFLVCQSVQSTVDWSKNLRQITDYNYNYKHWTLDRLQVQQITSSNIGQLTLRNIGHITGQTTVISPPLLLSQSPVVQLYYPDDPFLHPCVPVFFQQSLVQVSFLPPSVMVSSLCPDVWNCPHPHFHHQHL